MRGLFDELKKELPSIQRRVPLGKYTTFQIGGPAEYFFIAKNDAQIIRAIAVSQKLHLPVLIVGGGSNLLVSDKGVRGLTIKIQDGGKCLVRGNCITASAGIPMKKIVALSVEKSLKGLEWAGGLPGTFGGAIRGNAGAFGGEIKDSIIEVLALDGSLKIRKFSHNQCQFSYRSSVFKKENWIVLSATVRLKKGIKEELAKVVSLRIAYRKNCHPLEHPNAGSIFKNVALSEFSDKLKNRFSGVIKQDHFPVVPTACLISELGLKGLQIGGAKVSEKHPNFIVNVGKAKASDVLLLIEAIKEKTKKKYGVDLEPEVQYVE